MCHDIRGCYHHHENMFYTLDCNTFALHDGFPLAVTLFLPNRLGRPQLATKISAAAVKTR